MYIFYAFTINLLSVYVYMMNTPIGSASFPFLFDYNPPWRILSVLDTQLPTALRRFSSLGQSPTCRFGQEIVNLPSTIGAQEQ